MAPKNQGIMEISPILQERLIGKDTRKGLIGNISDAANVLSMEQFDPKAPQTGTTRQAIRDILKEPFRFGYNVVSNIPSVFQGISKTLDEQTDEARAKKASDVAQAMSGVEFGLPQDLDARDKGTIFTPEGQSALGAEISKQLQPIFTKETDGDIAEEENLIAGDVASEESDENLSNAQKATKGALDEFLKQARPGVSPKEYKDYIEEFGKATGLDISGDPDTKQALMSFGLALMQNRAGKGFNLSNILGAVGEAGEAALPEFSKAVSEAKAIRAKAGAFAISRKKEDEAEARNRKNYVIVPKGTGGLKGLAANMDKARNIPLNSFELNALLENENFSNQFEIVPDSQYDKVLEAALETPELGKKYMATKGTLPLFEGAEGLFDVPVQYPDRNYQGTDAATKPAFLGDTKAVEEAFRSMRKDIDRGKAQFKDLVDTINKEGVTVFDQSADAITNLGAAFGIKFRDDQTPTKKIELILNRIQSKYAPEILGETGKTISDADRQRVAKIVGELRFFQNPEDLKAAVERIFGDIIGTQERKLKQGLTTFNRLTNRQVTLNFGGGLTEKQQEELAAYEAKFNPKGT